MLAGDLRARIPEQPPRSLDLLPGLRLSRVLRQVAVPLAFVGLCSLLPITILLTTPGTKLSMWRTRTIAGRIEQAREAQDCLRDELRLQYSFSTNGVTFHGSDCVPSRAYASLQPADSVAVVYVDGDPGTNAVVEGRTVKNAPPWPVVFIFPLFILAFMGPMFWPVISRLLQDRRLFRTGIVVPGTVVFVSPRNPIKWPGWPGAARSDVFVAVKLPTGSEREVRAACDNEWLLSHLPPGAEVTVACHPTGSRAALLESYLR
jgi:hypothetical protein